jgi:hypothetical protein
VKVEACRVQSQNALGAILFICSTNLRQLNYYVWLLCMAVVAQCSGIGGSTAAATSPKSQRASTPSLARLLIATHEVRYHCYKQGCKPRTWRSWPANLLVAAVAYVHLCTKAGWTTASC